MRLSVPYRSQLDNAKNPYGSCNVTSLAMGMLYYNLPERPGLRLADELYKYCESNGFSRHSPYDLAKVFNAFCAKANIKAFSNFSIWGTVDKIKAHLENGQPVITHGWFTSFGHIIVIVGYNKEGFIVHDPYGEWNSWGYSRNTSCDPKKGKYLTYSYNLMSRKCRESDNTWWVHYLSGVAPSYSAEITAAVKTKMSGLRLQDIVERDLVLDINQAAGFCNGLVEQIQFCLENHLKESPGKIDGLFGAKTLRAYKAAMTTLLLNPASLGKWEAIALIQGFYSHAG